MLAKNVWVNAALNVDNQGSSDEQRLVPTVFTWIEDVSRVKALRLGVIRARRGWAEKISFHWAHSQ
jgi:hypothetical protein